MENISEFVYHLVMCDCRSKFLCVSFYYHTQLYFSQCNAIIHFSLKLLNARIYIHC